LESNKSVRPLRDKFGRKSLNAVSSGGPTFFGVDQGSWALARVET